jgi:hypothetical protein
MGVCMTVMTESAGGHSEFVPGEGLQSQRKNEEQASERKRREGQWRGEQQPGGGAGPGSVEKASVKAIEG